MDNGNTKISNNIGLLFLVVFLFVVIFLLRVFYISSHKPQSFISKQITHKDLAIRGKIISKDNFVIAQNEKMYNIAIMKKYLNPNKKEMFLKLLSIYTNTPVSYFKRQLRKYKHSNRVVLLKHIPFKIKKNLTYLSTVLALKNVFLRNEKKIVFGLDIYEEPSKRLYPFKNRLQPVLGYLRNNHGVIGLEATYNSILNPKETGYEKGFRDVQNHIIYDLKSTIKHRKDGDDLHLNVNLILQGKIENILDNLKTNMKAKELLAVVMETKTGKIISIASSNRFNPMKITKKEVPYLKISHIQYSYEPGSVMKPITLSLLLKHNKVNIYEILNAHNGIYYFKRHFTIYDDDAFQWLNVVQAVIHSSNIIFAQLGLRLTPQEFRNGLLSFGFGLKSGIDLPYESKGVIFSLRKLQSETHRASNSFGYAMQVNLIQLLKAYNTFNNEGIMVTPKIGDYFGNITLESKKTKVISASNAQTVLNILRKVVLKGTAVATNIPGLFIAGKTGTAKINKNNKYIKGLYNSSFIGFVNDKTHKYTIATLAIQPDKKRFFASQTAVVIFKNIVETMLEMNMLQKEERE